MRYLLSAGYVTLLATTCLAQDAPAQGRGMMSGLLPMMIAMFAIIYFLMIRPEQKKQKSRQAMLTAMKKGDRVVTIGGVFGTVGTVKDASVMIKIAENTIVEVRKSAVSEVLNKDKTSKTETKAAAK